jgi:arylsulfatase A-like enzyme
MNMSKFANHSFAVSRLGPNCFPLWLLASLGLLIVSSPTSADTTRPNVLFIVIDDQNDWVGPLNGHQLVKTPYLDSLAKRGEVFLNAHCQAPLCNPSRTSAMLSLRPTTTGVYGLAPWFREIPEWKHRVSLPQAFKAAGYETYTAGKVYHPFHDTAQLVDEFDIRGPEGEVGAKPPGRLIPRTPGNNPSMDWGVFPHRDEDKCDYQVASWAIENLKSAPKERPFFMAVGFSLPHVPCYVTQKWFDLYPDDDRLLPPVQSDDRADTPRFSWYLHWQLPEPRLKWLQQNNQWHNLVHSYLACTSFVDDQIGRVLTALETSGQAENTIVVVWSDHGWHLGEKEITGKNSLWERSTHVPLIFAGPGIPKGALCNEPAELLDMYPTLLELCNLSPRDDLEGHSLVPQMKNPNAKRAWPAITSHNQGNHSVRTTRWRFIHYADGSEELYDMQRDPNEWTNLAAEDKHRDTIIDLRKWLPVTDAPPAPGSAHRILTYDGATDEAVWEGQKVLRSDPIPD